MAKKLELELITETCPEQYWVKQETNTIGYIRLRWGHLTCDYLPNGELTDKDNIRAVDYTFPNDEYKGCFDTDKERTYWLNKCKNALYKQIHKEIWKTKKKKH